MTTLILVRHGQSEWNIAGRIQGQTDVPLSDLGRRQAAAVAQRLSGRPLAAVYASPLRRAHDTALAIAQRHGLPVVVVPELAEIDHGRWQGLTEAEVAASDGERLRLWTRLPGRVRMPGGEGLYDVRRRSLAAVRGLVALHDGQVMCLVSHDVVVKVLVAEVLGMDYDHLGRLIIDNCGVSIVEQDGQGARLMTLNDTAHLHGVQEPPPAG